MKKHTETYSEITPPDDLYRVKVEKDWRYGKHAMFWEIQEFSQELSNRYNEVYYQRACKGGLVYTKWGLKYQVWKKMRKMRHGDSINYFNIKLEQIQQ